jgi:DNA-binding beta-propeller fold protein YncE
MRRNRWLPLMLPALLVACTDDGPAGIIPEAVGNTASMSRGSSPVFPSRIPLPNGFQPEGIVIGRGNTFYVGSLAGPFAGAIYRGDLRTGAGSVLVSAPQAGQAVGLAHDSRTDYLFVAGGGFQAMYVYDGGTGAVIATVPLPGAALINDLVVTRDAVYLTDSFRPVLYRVPLGPGGRLLPNTVATELPLTGDYVFNPDAENGINNNGIVATPNGRQLIVVNMGTGRLYLVDAQTGEARVIDVGLLPSADGLVLQGRTLYAVQNFLNRIAVVQLAPDYTAGTIERYITDPGFRIPTTADLFGNALYAVNARFDVASPFAPNPDVLSVDFDVVRVTR